MTFQFSEMTPDFQRYLDFQRAKTKEGSQVYTRARSAEEVWEKAGKPSDGPLYDQLKSEKEAQKKWWEERNKEANRLESLLPPGILHRYHREQIEWSCREGAESETTHLSDSGKYRLTTTIHGTGTWSCSRGVVQGPTLPPISVYRNYTHFPFLWVEGHPNGHDYLICGEDYQGYTIIELDTGRRVDYLPPGEKKGHGWCPCSWVAAPSKLTLGIEGCYWACPEDVWIVDFSEPLSVPLPILAAFPGADKFFGWREGSPDTCDIGREVEIYIPLDKPTDHLTQTEYEAILHFEGDDETYEALFRTEDVKSAWVRSSDEEDAIQLLNNLCSWFLREEDRHLSEDWAEMAQILVKRLPLNVQSHWTVKLRLPIGKAPDPASCP